MNRCRISTYIWDLENGTDEPISRAGIVTQPDNECVDTAWEERWGDWEINIDAHYLCVTQLEGGCSVVEGSTWG